MFKYSDTDTKVNASRAHTDKTLFDFLVDSMVSPVWPMPICIAPQMA